MSLQTIAAPSVRRAAHPLRTAFARVVETLRAGHIGLVLKFGVSAGLVTLVCRQIDGPALVAQLGSQSPIWLGATVLIGILQIVLLSLRWQQILKGLGAESGLRSALTVTFMGCFFGAFLFGQTGGDVARAVLAPPRSLGRRGIVHSVVFERMATATGVGLAAVAAIILADSALAKRLPLAAGLGLALFLALLGAGGLAFVVWLAKTIGGRAAALFLQTLRELEDSGRRLLAAWPRVAAAIALAAVGQLLVAAEAWCLAQALHLDVPFIDFAILMPVVMLAVALPISAGGWGVREGTIVAVLGFVGVDGASALLLSVELGLIATLVSLPGGAMWLYRCCSRAN